MTARLGASLLSVLAVAMPAAAQEEGDPVAGQELATQLCSACHIVGTERVGSDVAPPFPVIARGPDMTLTQLHAWVGPRTRCCPSLRSQPASGVGGGRPYAVRMTLALGIDLGGTKIEIIGLDERGAVLLRRRRPSPQGSYAATLAAIRDLVAEVEAELGARGSIGFGTPGAISPATGLLKNSNSTWLNGKPLDRDLADILARPIALANDADCLALS